MLAQPGCIERDAFGRKHDACGFEAHRDDRIAADQHGAA